MSFFWPTRLRPDPGAFGYLGRVIHWASVLVALFLAAVIFNANYEPGAGNIEAVLLWDLPILLVGRGVRFFFAGE